MFDTAHYVQDKPVSLDEESVLIARIKCGDQVACNALVEWFRPRMLTVARRYMHCEEDCSDALQDAFISAFRALPRFEGHCRLRTWLHRITVNACLMKRRSRRSREDRSFEASLAKLSGRPESAGRADWSREPSMEVENEETRAAVRKAINQLPDNYRMVLLLRDIEEMDTATTAIRLETSEHNVKRRLHRARRQLFGVLEPLLAGGTDLRSKSSAVNNASARRLFSAGQPIPTSNTRRDNREHLKVESK